MNPRDRSQNNRDPRHEQARSPGPRTSGGARKAERRRLAKLEAAGRAAFERLLDEHGEMVLFGEDETAVVFRDVGAIFISQVDGVTVIEAVAHSGPGVEERKAILDQKMREAGLGRLVDERDRRAKEAS